MSRAARAPVSAIRAVFLDDGGVLNDNDCRAPEWRRLLGEYFAPRFGGTPQAWGEADAKLPGAVRVPADEADAHLSEIPRDRAVITYCT